ncbi:MAG: MFS transporter [Actinomycetota bacterium]|nr:MFS transporter [Actinomycetota bacterium]
MSELDAPTTEVSRAWTARFSLAWFGIWMAYLVPIQLAMPDQLSALDHPHRIRDFGLINGLIGIAALVTLPLFGALCDRTRSRFGRRRLWILSGAVVFALGLAATGLQSNWGGIAIAWLIASLGVNMATAGLTAIIADDVPDRQRGMVSSAIYGPQAIGVVVGLIALSPVKTAQPRYLLLAAAVLIFVWPFGWRYREAATARPSSAITLRSILAGLWVDHPDFGWAFGGRLLVNLGNAFGTTYLLFFLRDYLKVSDPDGSLIVLTLIYLVFTLLATYGGGILSDRTGRRRIFVAVASALQASAALLLSLVPTYHNSLIAAALLGAGYGAYMSVDQAVVTEVLPDARDRAKDLGIMNVGSVGPQAFGPLAASLVIASLGGYRVLFALAGLTSLAGAFMVYRIRSVR